MADRFRTTRQVEFADTDMAGIVHFAHFFRWMESVEHEFFRSLGIALHEQQDGAMTGFARVHAACDYERPLRYPETFAVELRVESKTRSSLGYRFRFCRLDRGGADGELIARGTLRTVHVRREAGQSGMHSAELPEAVERRIQVHPDFLSNESNEPARPSERR